MWLTSVKPAINVAKPGKRAAASFLKRQKCEVIFLQIYDEMKDKVSGFFLYFISKLDLSYRRVGYRTSGITRGE